MVLSELLDQPYQFICINLYFSLFGLLLPILIKGLLFTFGNSLPVTFIYCMSQINTSLMFHRFYIQYALSMWSFTYHSCMHVAPLYLSFSLFLKIHISSNISTKFWTYFANIGIFQYNFTSGEFKKTIHHNISQLCCYKSKLCPCYHMLILWESRICHCIAYTSL